MSSSEFKEAIQSLSLDELYELAYHFCRQIQVELSAELEELAKHGISVARFCYLLSEQPELKGDVSMQELVLIIKACDDVLDGQLGMLIRTTPESVVMSKMTITNQNQQQSKEGCNNGNE